MRTLSLLCAAALAAAAQSPFRQSGWTEPPAGWTVWSPRAEIAPRGFVDTVHGRGEPGSLALSGNSNPGVFGGWERTVPGIEAGRWYRFTAWYRAEGAPHDQFQVVARLDWEAATGKRAGKPEYVWRSNREGEWTRVTADVPAPPEAAAVKLQLLMQNAPGATVWWDEVCLEAIPAPPPRPVRVASINFRPKKTADSVAEFLKVVDEAVREPADVILLGEGITVVGTGKKYADVAEPVPGPTTARLGELARRKRSYVAAGIYEREGPLVYNTAVLLDRAGKLLGKYRKVYIPREEVEGGITPGSDYPVFRTDFGTVGIMICWDLQYTDPARELARRGAEIILLPIWGGNEALAKARAIENHVFLAASGYDHPTYVMDPEGELVAVARERGTAAMATLDLNRRYVEPWLGEMRGRFMKELRVDMR